MKKRMTEKWVEKAERDPLVAAALEKSGRATIFDAAEPSLQLRITKAGTKTWRVTYFVPKGTDANGRATHTKRCLTIGWHPATDLAKARGEATRVRTARLDGRDPAAERAKAKAAERSAAVLDQWWAEWSEEQAARVWRPSTTADYQSIWRTAIAPAFGNRPVGGIAMEEVDAWHRAIGRKHPVRANRALAVLKACLNEAIRRRIMPGPNPCVGIRKFRETPRERFLTREETAILWQAIDDEEALGGRAAVPRVGESQGKGGRGMREAESRGISAGTAGLFRLLLLTGARLSEIKDAQWHEVDLEAGALRLPASRNKAGKAKTIWLNALARREVEKLRAIRSPGCPWVVPGRIADGGLVNAQKPWQRVRDRADAIVSEARAEAGLPPLEEGPFARLRIHDLRHAYASVALAGGAPLAVVGKALGHANPATTNRYAHLADDPVRATADLVGAAIEEALRSHSVGAEAGGAGKGSIR